MEPTEKPDLEKQVRELLTDVKDLKEQMLTLQQGFMNLRLLVTRGNLRGASKKIAADLNLRGTPAPVNDCAKCGGTGQLFILGTGTVQCECVPEFSQRFRLWNQLNGVHHKAYVTKEPKKKAP